ncbi:hypothetical protein DAPPUDRAFT_320016 [Daphnia pulex]|uniref:Uncharacterized protein n=1 Tax=Daphnia pulex TaxID=6669 RepID=E9GNL0_DAPPU|nr:hypothetical protein DAPPUDRAFT_320016 [Daphnia pulex]|eukprot:EFX78788.1 hypothetical protein DAPPUDRAFT_320016 [Daphnia pulex]
MDLIFGDDPAIELKHVAGVGDRGPKETATSSTNPSNWKTQLISIEKEKVDVLKDIARSQVKKTETFDRLTSLIEKGSQK